jgi:Flp pilus assembly protein TadG
LQQFFSRPEVSSMPHPLITIGNALRRFRRNRRGSAAVEFALVAPMFFGLLFAIIETGMVFFAGQVLETVTQDSARAIMTGQTQGASVSQSQFKTEVCGRIVALFDCVNGIYVDVRSYPSFGTVVIPNQIDAGKNFINDMKFCPGKPEEIVVVRVFYQWPLFLTSLGFNLADLAGSKRLLTATTTFKNEPFSGAGATCS